LLGMPYMGVGRNLMYKRKLFVDKLGFRNHQKITGGDDDLFVNENANGINTAICFHPDTYTYSEPKHSFADWFIQKKRHLHVGKRYKQRDKLLLGIYSITHILVWLLIPAILFIPIKFQIIIGGVFLFRILIFWIFGGIANSKLGSTIKWYALPMYDLLYSIYFATMGWYSVVNSKKIKWR
jgi:hypothetical protein